MSKIAIKGRWTNLTLFECEKKNNNLKDTIEKAVKGGANLEGAYIYLHGYEINISERIKEFEENSNIKITEYYINKNIIPTRWNCFWKYGLIICDFKINEKSVEEMTLPEVCKALSKNC